MCGAHSTARSVAEYDKETFRCPRKVKTPVNKPCQGKAFSVCEVRVCLCRFHTWKNDVNHGLRMLR